MTYSNTSQKTSGFTMSKKGNKPTASDFSAYFSLENNPLIDIISARYHSSDFNQTRANYICGRLWLMCLFFAISVPLFSFFDFAILPSYEAQNLLYARLALSASLFFIAYTLRKQPNLITLRGITLIAFLLPTLFYLYTMESFSGLAQTQVPIVYSMMPYLTVAMLGLFPLTILGGVALISVVFIPFAGFQIGQLEVSFWPLINAIWLFLLFAGISLWQQASQLSMLMKLYRESTVDPLTKLINRRVMMRMAEKEQKRSRDADVPFSVIMFDLDKFKRVNDEHGHHIGDKVLVMTAKTMKQVLKQNTIAARFGGEEFVAILPDTKLDQAVEVATAIQATLKQQSITLDQGKELKVTASIGVAQHQQDESLEQIFKRVDDLLYAAKGGGRDRVVAE